MRISQIRKCDATEFTGFFKFWESQMKIMKIQYSRSLGEGTLLWAISFFLNEKKINIFRLMHITLFLKVTY